MDLIQAFIKKGCPVTNCHNWIYDIQAWLRDIHNIHVYPILEVNGISQYYRYKIAIVEEHNAFYRVNKTSMSIFSKYEEALIDGINLVYNLYFYD